ncbi:MAG: hypothetical protein D6690_09415 [Nitrospirae bacterium]|nr:MAG: hypothetical protein D6690_09415 [Nitrospirota bacterium]
MYQEEKTFTVRIALEAQFPDHYDGEEDAHGWLHDWETQVKPELLKAIFATLRRFPGWTAHVRNRGVSPADEIEIALVKVFPHAE